MRIMTSSCLYMPFFLQPSVTKDINVRLATRTVSSRLRVIDAIITIRLQPNFWRNLWLADGTPSPSRRWFVLTFLFCLWTIASTNMSFKPKCDRALENVRKRLIKKDRYYEGNLAAQNDWIRRYVTEESCGRAILQRLQQLMEMRTTNLVHSNETPADRLSTMRNHLNWNRNLQPLLQVLGPSMTPWQHDTRKTLSLLYQRAWLGSKTSRLTQLHIQLGSEGCCLYQQLRMLLTFL